MRRAAWILAAIGKHEIVGGAERLENLLSGPRSASKRPSQWLWHNFASRSRLVF